MTRPIFITPFLFLAALATSSCEQKVAGTNNADTNKNTGEKIDIRTLGGGLYYVNRQCSTTDTVVVQKFYLKLNGFDAKNLNEKFIDESTRMEAPAPSTPPEGGRTPLDISVKLTKDNDAALITIDLNGSGLEFMPNNGANKMAITAADGGGLQMICDIEFDPSQPRIAKFKVFRKGGVGGKDAFAGYNLGLFYRRSDGTLVPFHVDPNIKNDG